jgi:DNA-binding winged helix-turn-helix (wHTH) protein/Tfp pilus assembly protein PilF
MAQTGLHYEFGPFRVDSRERLLWRNGKVVPLTPKVFDILLVLIQSRGHILSKEKLMKLVWPDTVVEENNLTRNISTLRKALGDGSKQPRYIETIPWRGYRFVAALKELPDELGAIDSLAVLPFLNGGSDPAAEYLCDGITDSLINKLSLLPNLRVMSRNSIFRYKAHSADTGLTQAQRVGFPRADVVGRELDVRAVLMGRVSEAGEILIVSVELVDARDNRHLWGAQYNRPLADLFATQETISLEISERLRLKLTREEQQRLSKRYTENTEAYQLYLKGCYYWHKLTIDGVGKGIELFQQAIEKDPGYALAYTGLLDCYTYLGSPVEAKRAATRALELDPKLGEAHASLGFSTFLYDWDFPEAERRFKRAIELKPNYAEAHHWYAIYLANMGRHEDAIHEAQRAQELDPLSLLMNQTAGNVLVCAREYDRAVEALRKTIDMDANFAAPHSTLGLVYVELGLYELAMAQFEKVRALLGNDVRMEPSLKALSGYVYAAWGKASEALKMAEEISSQPAGLPYSIAAIYARLGEKDRALEWLERAYRERSFELVGLKVDPRFDNLRRDPRLQDLLRRVGFAP